MSELRKWYRLNERYIGQGKEFGPRPEWATELVALMDQGVFWCDSPPPVDPSGYRLDHVTSVRRIVDHWAGDSECIRVAELLDRSDAGETERNPLQQVESGVAKVIDGLSKMGKAAAGPQPDETSATEATRQIAQWEALTERPRVEVTGIVRNNLTAAEFLHESAAVQEQRGQQYDTPGGERSAGAIAAAFSAITGKQVTAAEVYLLLQITKDVRQWTARSYHHDSALDSVSYAALKAEALAAEGVSDE